MFVFRMKQESYFFNIGTILLNAVQVDIIKIDHLDYGAESLEDRIFNV